MTLGSRTTCKKVRATVVETRGRAMDDDGDVGTVVSPGGSPPARIDNADAANLETILTIQH